MGSQLGEADERNISEEATRRIYLKKNTISREEGRENRVLPSATSLMASRPRHLSQKTGAAAPRLLAV